MKIEVTHTAVYDIDALMPEFIESQGDHDLTLDALSNFIFDRFINPNFDVSGDSSTTINIIDPYAKQVYETDYGVYCSAKCAEPDTDELGREVPLNEYNYPDGITCPACDKVVQYKLGEEK